MMITYDYVARILAANNFNSTDFLCSDGARITIIPCSQVSEIKSLDDVEYFLVHGDMPWMGNSDLQKIVDDMNNHAKLLAEIEDEKTQLRAYFDQHQANGWDDESWSWYSDWHKDVYGYRPHGRVCGEYVSIYG